MAVLFAANYATYKYRLQAALSLYIGVHETKSTDMHNTDWVRLASLASLAGMSCTVCMVAACTQG